MKTKQNIFIDIETIRSEQPPSRDDIKVPANYSKPETIEKYINENLELEWNKTALNSLKGRIFCIGYAIDDEPVQVLKGNEQEIILSLQEVVKGQWFDWVGHNILDFDLPYIYHRTIKYDAKMLRMMIPHQKFDKQVKDTMVMFAGTNYSAKHSIKNIANFLGLENGKEEMDGSMVGKLWEQGEFEKIYEYCKSDVELLRQIYYKIEM